MISAKTARERACATNANVETTLKAIEEDITTATDRGLFSTTVTHTFSCFKTLCSLPPMV